MKEFRKFTHHQVRVLIKHLKKFAPDKDPETLHQIRVDVKKIKAILEAMNGCLKKFKSHKRFIPFRNIFRKAGEVREPKILSGLIHQYKVDAMPESQLPGNGQKSAAEFYADVRHFIRVVKDNAKKLEPLSKKVHRKDFHKYISKRKKEIKSQLFPRPIMSEIHRVRKSIKEVAYLSEIGKKLTNKEEQFYNKMQEVIGQLHNKQVLLAVLKKKKQKKDSIDSERVKSECQADKKQILELVSHYYSAEK